MMKIIKDFSHSGEGEKSCALILYFSQSELKEASSIPDIVSAILPKDSSSLFMWEILTLDRG